MIDKFLPGVVRFFLLLSIVFFLFPEISFGTDWKFLEASDSAVLKFGRNVDIDSGAVEDVWDGGGTYVYPTQARVHNVASAEAADDAAGTGCRTLDVQGHNSLFEFQQETVIMDGTTDAPTALSYTRIFRMKCLTAGSGGVNAGVIAATAVTDATVTAQILAGNNQTLMAIYTIPKDTTGYVADYYATMNRSVTTGAADAFLWVRTLDSVGVGVWQLKHVRGIVGAGSSALDQSWAPLFLKIQGPADIRIQADASANNTDISAGFNLIEVPLGD